jgi:hypothetical protein
MTRWTPSEKGVCSKIKRLAKVTRKEDLYRSLDPRD